MRTLFRILLRLYPRDVREEFGPEMLNVAESCTREYGGTWRLILECAGLMRGAAREHSIRLIGSWLPLAAAGLAIAGVAHWLLYSLFLRALPSFPVYSPDTNWSGQFTLGLMAVGVLMVLVPLTVVLSTSIRRRERKQRLR